MLLGRGAVASVSRKARGVSLTSGERVFRREGVSRRMSWWEQCSRKADVPVSFVKRCLKRSRRSKEMPLPRPMSWLPGMTVIWRMSSCGGKTRQKRLYSRSHLNHESQFQTNTEKVKKKFEIY
jgi:hypothetical protein